MRILCVHAHFDDFEFSCGGTFARLQALHGDALRARVLICTDGAAGHHRRSREETARLRRAEQERSAEVGGYELEVLTLPNGDVPREGCLQVGRDLLAALWEAIRRFEPDYLFCPPIPRDALEGIHVDHVTVAEAIRKVAYLINVPHVYTPEYPIDEGPAPPVKVPVILNVTDGYRRGRITYDFAVDIGEVFETVVQMSYCHQSQIKEWLPWVTGRPAPEDVEAWRELLRTRFAARGQALGLDLPTPVEAFTVTAWGSVPSYDQLTRDFPPMTGIVERKAAFRARLAEWGGGHVSKG
jgi:LmbE family N-acetylglucosaminyl deacetylase